MSRTIGLLFLCASALLLTACNVGERPKSKNWADFVERYGCTRGKMINNALSEDGKRIEWECAGLVFGQNGTHAEPSSTQLLKFEQMMAEHGIKPRIGSEPVGDSKLRPEEETVDRAMEMPAREPEREAEHEGGQWSMLCYIVPFCD